VARQEGLVQCRGVPVVEFPAPVGETQQVQHDDGPTGVLGKKAFEVGTTRINSHARSLAHRHNVDGARLFSRSEGVGHAIVIVVDLFLFADVAIVAVSSAQDECGEECQDAQGLP
jgi:hypothetical protein